MTWIETPALSARLGASVTLASEAFQWTGSFKFRSAQHIVSSVPHSRIIAASSGNFGQALALACQFAGKRCTVVMPQNSARVKIDAVQAFGATVDLIDTTVISRDERLRQLAGQDSDIYVASSHDDPLALAGNASLGREMAKRGFDAIVAPVGGGGAASGVVNGLRESGDLVPVWAAEPAVADDFIRSLRVGYIVGFDEEPQTVADGARARRLSHQSWGVLQHGVAGAISVPEETIREGVRVLFALANVKAEPTGALATAALLAEPERFRGCRVCCLVTGGNVDPGTYSAILVGP